MAAGRKKKPFDYDVCLSFAGEDRTYVEAVAEELKSRGVRIFYDMYEEEILWGKDLFEHLDYVYSSAARYCVMFVSRHYAKKIWTNHERKAAQERALHSTKGYILPARFDSTKLPGIRSTLGYVDLKKRSPEEFAKLLIRKLTPDKILEFQSLSNYLPPRLDKLHSCFEDTNEESKKLISHYAHSFLKSLVRLDADELLIVAMVLTHSCPHELSKNFHIDLDLLRRLTKFPISKIKKIAHGMSSVGLYGKFITGKKHKGVNVYLTWDKDGPDTFLLRKKYGITPNSVAAAISSVMSKQYCEFHALKCFMLLNFCALSEATSVPDVH